MNQQNLKVIGFDLGHGEVSLAKINDISPESDKLDTQSLQLHKQKSQPTAVAYIENRGVVFGDQAMRQGASAFEIAFKKRPSSDSEYQKNIQDLVRAIYLHLIGTDQIQENNQNHFFIGCPSGWTEDERKNYEALFMAIGLKNVTVVSESRAALMQAIDNAILTKEELSKSVIIIDVGSSTTDLTLVQNIQDQPIDFGDDIGASLIDKAILEYSIAHSEDREQLEEILSRNKHYKNKCEFLCRKAKEEYFCNEINYDEPDSCVRVGYEKLTPDIIFEPLLNQEIMDKLLRQGLPSLQKSWIDAFTDLLTETKQKLEANAINANAILLTGGVQTWTLSRK